MPNDIDEVSRLLGELGGKLDALTRQADNNERNSKGRWKTAMPRAVETAIKIWAAPVLLAALCTVCGYLWVDQARRMDRMADELADLNEAVITLQVLAGR